MSSFFISQRIAGIYGQCLLPTRSSLLQATTRQKLIPCSIIIATIHTASKNSLFDQLRRGTRSANQTFSRRKWTPEEDQRLKELYDIHGPAYTILCSHFTKRSPSAIYSRCRIILNSKHSSTGKFGPWTKEELDVLRRLTLNTPAERIDWLDVQRQLPQPRNLALIKQSWYHSINPKWNHGLWTEEETMRLLKLVGNVGEQDWCRVSDMIGSRSPRQCLEKYRYQLQPSHKGRFTQIEDDAILAAVAKHGDGDFMVIKMEAQSQRTPRQISHHYRAKLDPAYDRSTWTEQEKYELYKLAQGSNGIDMLKIRERMNSKRHVKDMWNQYMLVKRTLSKQEEKAATTTDNATPTPTPTLTSKD